MYKFFTALYNSTFNISWLKAQRFFPGKAWGYFSLFILALAVVSTVPVIVSLRPAALQMQHLLATDIPDFEAKVENGKLTLWRVKQPWVYHKDGWLVVADTVGTNTISISNYASSTDEDTILITTEKIEVHDDYSGETRTQKWSDVPNFSLTKQQVQSAVDYFVKPWFVVLASLVVLAGGYIGLFISRVYSVVVVSLIVSIVVKLTGRAFRVKELLVMGLYAVTLPTIISIIFTLTGIGFSYIHFIALLAFMLALVLTNDESVIREEEL